MIVDAGNDGQFRHFVTAGGEAHLADNPLYDQPPKRLRVKRLRVNGSRY
jgi:formyl-CoA transferase